MPTSSVSLRTSYLCSHLQPSKRICVDVLYMLKQIWMDIFLKEVASDTWQRSANAICTFVCMLTFCCRLALCCFAKQKTSWPLAPEWLSSTCHSKRVAFLYLSSQGGSQHICIYRQLFSPHCQSHATSESCLPVSHRAKWYLVGSAAITIWSTNLIDTKVLWHLLICVQNLDLLVRFKVWV